MGRHPVYQLRRELKNGRMLAEVAYLFDSPATGGVGGRSGPSAGDSCAESRPWLGMPASRLLSTW